MVRRVGLVIVLLIVAGASTSQCVAATPPPKTNGIIAFTRDGDRSGPRIYGVKPTGRGLHRISPPSRTRHALHYDPTDASDATFSRAGNELAFISNDRLFEMGPSGTRVHQVLPLVGNLDRPCYSPDDSTILSGEAVRSYWFTVPSTGVESKATPIPGTELMLGGCWSPDGTVILAEALTTSGGIQLVTLKTDGSEVTAIPGSGGDSHPSYSPDGRQIVYEHDLRPTGRIGLFEMGADGSGVHRLSRVVCTGSTPAEPIYSPDGRFIAFSCRRPSEREPSIWVMRSNGTDPRRITSPGNQAEDTAPTWQPLPARGGS